MKGRKSLAPEWNLKQEQGREMYIDHCSWNERFWLALFRLGIWKMRGIRSGAEREGCHLCNE